MPMAHWFVPRGLVPKDASPYAKQELRRSSLAPRAQPQAVLHFSNAELHPTARHIIFSDLKTRSRAPGMGFLRFFFRRCASLLGVREACRNRQLSEEFLTIGSKDLSLEVKTRLAVLPFQKSTLISMYGAMWRPRGLHMTLRMVG